MEELGRVKAQGAALCEPMALKRKVASLEQRLTALLQHQGHAHEQLTQWQQAFGAFAQHIAPPLLGSTPVSEKRQAGNRHDSLEPQHRTEQERPSKRLCRDAACMAVKDSSRGSAPSRPEPISDAVGTALHMASGSEGDHTSTGTVAGPDGNALGVLEAHPAVQSLAQSPLHECSSSRLVACHHMMPSGCHATARTQAPPQQQPGKALESSAAGHAADREADPPSAMDLVESWLVQLLDRQQPADLAKNVAAGLAAAISADACLLPCVVAGFESTLLRSASSPERRVPSSPAKSCSPATADADFIGSQHIVQSKQWSAAHVGLDCAVEIDQHLIAVGSHQQCLLTLLQQQLHQASLQDEDAWETEACTLAAAVAHLYRLQHNQQVMSHITDLSGCCSCATNILSLLSIGALQVPEQCLLCAGAACPVVRHADVSGGGTCSGPTAHLSSDLSLAFAIGERRFLCR